MVKERTTSLAALVPLLAGLLWLWCAASFGVVGFLFSLIPGCLLLASGVGLVLWPGDLRIPEFAALGGVLGVPLAFPVFFVAGPLDALALIGLSVASYVVAGALAVEYEAPVEDVPPVRRGLSLWAQVAADEALLATMQATLPMPTRDDWRRIHHEVMEANHVFESAGWLEKPAEFHRTPPPLEEPQLRPARVRGIDYEHLSFESGYAPHPDEPARNRWLSYAPNRTAHAWVLRHPGPPRPWLVCIHGFQMGWALSDLTVFAPEYFHRRLGLNMLCPVLPLHGARKVGRRSGDGYLSGDVLDSLHAEAQAMWDIRRLLSWIRAQDAPAVGVLGLSLGGYQTALLACLDDDLACAIPGIPLTDVSRVYWRHGPMRQIRRAEYEGLGQDAAARVLSVVSPLVLEPKVPWERRAIYGAVADRLVTPDQVRDLWHHWDQPKMVWYQGGHLTFRIHPEVHALVRDTLRKSGLTRT